MPKTADIIAAALYEDGVRYAFGIPGGEVLELLEAFRKLPAEEDPFASYFRSIGGYVIERRT